jgi:hypothetical protein
MCAVLALSGCGSHYPTSQALKRACDVVNSFPNDYVSNHWTAYSDRIARTARTMHNQTQRAVLTVVASATHAYARTPRRVNGPTGDRYFEAVGVLDRLCDSNGTPMLP